MTHSCAVKGCIGVALLGSAAAIHAQALPPPPASPPPVMGYEYDPNGNLKKTTLAPQAPGFGHATERSYDDLQRLRTITDARNGVVQLEHTGRGDLTKVTDPRQLVTHYPRNGLGDATSVDSPDTGIATRAYDEAGNLKTLTDSRGARSSYTYDALNRLTRVIHTMPGRSLQTFRWTYDQTGPGYSHGVGRLTSTAFPVGTSTIAYDEHGRILKETQRVDTGVTGQRITTSVGYTYDAAGRLTSVLYPSGPLVRVDYAGGLPSSVSLARNATAAPSTLIDQIRHEPFGAIAGWR